MINSGGHCRTTWYSNKVTYYTSFEDLQKCRLFCSTDATYNLKFISCRLLWSATEDKWIRLVVTSPILSFPNYNPANVGIHQQQSFNTTLETASRMDSINWLNFTNWLDSDNWYDSIDWLPNFDSLISTLVIYSIQ